MKGNSCRAAAPGRSVKRAVRGLSVLRGGVCAFLAGMGAACGAVREPVAGPSTDIAVRQSAQCVRESYPAALPAAAALLDTAELGDAVRGLLGGAGVRMGEATLSLWYDPDGTNVRRDLLRHNLPPAVADSLQQLVFAALGAAPAQERAWGARLHLVAGTRVAYAVSHREYCPPRPRSRQMESDMAQFQNTGVRYRGGVRERMLLMQVTVHPAGFVADARVLRGGAQGSALEAQLRNQLRQYSFIPASLDGVPVQGDLAVPIRLRG